MPPAASNSVWSQELQVHWPKSWRFLSGRDLLLEMFTPRVFNSTADSLQIRYGENQDLRVSPYGLHIRIISLEPLDDRTADVVSKVFRVIEPEKLNEFEATFSHVRPIDMDYDEARQTLATIFYESWIRERPLKDFALLWDENLSPEGSCKFQLGVVNSDELLERVAQASGSADDLLRRQTPAWMKVRMPRVALFMESIYSSEQEVSPDLGSTQVPKTWIEWRERSDDLFKTLTELAIPAQRGEAL